MSETYKKNEGNACYLYGFENNSKTMESVKIVENKIVNIDNAINKIDKNKLMKPHFRKYTKEGREFVKTDIAYTSFLILNETYLPSVLVLGYSLRKYKNNYNLICMVQDKPEKKIINGVETYFEGVSKKGIDAILEIYDVVYGIDLLQLEPPKHGEHFTERIKHYSNISIYVSKSQVFGLIDYKRVLYLDASTVVHCNLNYMFSEYDKYAFLYNSSVSKCGMGIHGAVFIIEPSLKLYSKSLYLINNYNTVFGDLYFKRGIDETILYFTVFPKWSKKLIKKWTRCTENYMLSKCKIFHYQIDKPFKKVESEKGCTFIVWDKYAKELLRKYPQFITYFQHIREFRKVNY